MGAPQANRLVPLSQGGMSIGQLTKGRRFYVQIKRQLATDSEVLCRTSAQQT